MSTPISQSPVGSPEEFCDVLRVERILLEMPSGHTHRFDRGPVSVLVHKEPNSMHVTRAGQRPMTFDLGVDLVFEVARYVVNAAGSTQEIAA